VREVLVASGFKPEANLIEIMNPLDEGLFGWFTVNFLLKQFEGDLGKDQLGNSYASLDLGGGSTQITFAPSDPQNIPGIEGRKHFKHSVSVLGDNHQVYSHSYLGLGLQAARQAVLELENSDVISVGGEVTSSCMTSKNPKGWSFQGREFTISTKGEGASSHAHCTNTVGQILKDVHQPEELKSREIAAFSYFFDLAQEMGLVPEGSYERKVRVGDFADAAKEACGPKGTGFNCFDLTFAYQLLSQGYGLPDSKAVHLFKKINGHEASWALGLAFNILTAAASP